MDKAKYTVVRLPSAVGTLDANGTLQYLENRITKIQNHPFLNEDYKHGATTMIADLLYELGYTLEIERS